MELTRIVRRPNESVLSSFSTIAIVWGGCPLRKISGFLLTLVLSAFLLSIHAVAADAENLPNEAQLSADRMRFDVQTGDFLATGNVVIKAEGLTVRAPRGTGNVRHKEIHFEEGIVASGDWQGDWVDFAAGAISLYFAQTPTYIAEGGVKGDVGRIFVDADKLYMKGTEIAAKGVRRFEDFETAVAFGAESLNGTLLNGILTTLIAQNKVWLQGRPNSQGDMVDVRGDTAVYSQERGSVVLSGNVRAKQGGRDLTAQSLVYFPGNNRIEAIGGLVGKGENADLVPARITIDLSQEKRREQ